ncbi:hypothetical protein FA95DRAFT_1663050 [Auriscalpium vulgare]|uniref:Uncharacterized protein n=1 Tax=Auriscalpium vulgare TaxID=40419 RepID=A0ACB8R2T1_9AGAM|nr:hypothetical protein FA95DRAFT_1663050 [Auriscalpium vulgare]
MLQDLEKSLKQVREAEDVKPIVRVAAHASILLAQKYHSLTNEFMCPNKKLQWRKVAVPRDIRSRQQPAFWSEGRPFNLLTNWVHVSDLAPLSDEISCFWQLPTSPEAALGAAGGCKRLVLRT